MIEKRQLSRHNQVSDKKFGLTMAAICLLAFVWLFIRNEIVSIYLLIAAGLLSLIAFVTPSWLSPLNKVWFYVGYVLQRLVSPIILGFMFFGLLWPAGQLRKLFSGSKKKQINANSYWIPSEKPSDPFKHMY